MKVCMSNEKLWEFFQGVVKGRVSDHLHVFVDPVPAGNHPLSGRRIGSLKKPCGHVPSSIKAQVMRCSENWSIVWAPKCPGTRAALLFAPHCTRCGIVLSVDKHSKGGNIPLGGIMEVVVARAPAGCWSGGTPFDWAHLPTFFGDYDYDAYGGPDGEEREFDEFSIDEDGEEFIDEDPGEGGMELDKRIMCVDCLETLIAPSRKAWEYYANAIDDFVIDGNVDALKSIVSVVDEHMRRVVYRGKTEGLPELPSDASSESI